MTRFAGEEVTAEWLKNDAILHGFKPEALVLTVSGLKVLVTSWPWLEGTGDDETALIMARSDPADPSTNAPRRYFLLMRLVGQQSLDGFMSLEEAVAELNALADPMEVLKDIPNDTEGKVRCENCPVARYLGKRVGREVWVTCTGEVRFNTDQLTKPSFQLNEELVMTIARFDVKHYERLFKPEP